ncbi:DUF2937 family protein [Hwanghaeella sp.]|uniref:DUF2937 family protein n=1 Tax=Hwanghaeella sp. TaxID=2605943 RepID=UPI003CCC08D5
MRRWILIAFGLLCAAALSQIPTFHQQYLQRLGGHVDELAQQVSAIDERAEKVDKQRYDYIRDLIGNSDASARQEGEYLLELVTRHVTLRNSLQRLETMPMLYIGGALLLECDPKIAFATLKNLKPAVPLTLAGAGYAIAGFYIGYLGLMFLISLFHWRKVPVKEPEARER